FPDKADGPVAFVRDVVGGGQECVGHGAPLVLLCWTDEQQDVAATVPVMNVALPGFRILRGGRLRLPMKQRWRNRIVLVERGRRIFAFGLLECHKEEVSHGTPRVV